MPRSRSSKRRAPTTPPAPTAAAPAAPLSPARRRIFVAITLLAPWLLLALVELGLRVGGYGSGYALFVPFPDRPDWLSPNPAIGRRWFDDGPFAPTPTLDFFRAEKAPGSYRIVFQGESSAQGFPYGHGGAPSRMLAERLRATFPERPIEVVNTALTAVNSYTLLDQADEIVAVHPDAVLIYTGHNEYYGAYGVGASRALGGSPRVTRAYLALRRLRLVQLLAHLLAPRAATGGDGAADAPRNVMELMAGEQRIPLGSPRYEAGLAQLRANLRALLARYRAHGIPVLVGTVASNERDQAPFIGGPAARDSAAWWREMRDARDALARGDSASAERALERATRVDTLAADAFWLLARVREARGDSSGAHELYRAAKDRDELRFRAPEAVNAVIREVAAAEGATVVETERALERASPGGTVGRTLVLEHLHPNLDGYFVIADAFYAALRGRGMIAASWPAAVPASRARTELPVTPMDSVAGLLRTDRLTSGWPFRPRGTSVTPAVDTLHPRDVVEQLAQRVVLGGSSWPDATSELQRWYERRGDRDQARRAAVAMGAELGFSAQPMMDAARLSIGAGDYALALRYAREAARREETPNDVQLVGLLTLRLGDERGALPYLERAAQLAPGEQRMTVPLAAARALPEHEAARRRAPTDTAALFALATDYAFTQQFEKAREVLTELRRVAPGHAGARELLRRLPPVDPVPPAPPPPHAGKGGG